MKHDPRGKWIHVHDETTGIWAGTRPWGVETHLDVTPALVEYFDRYLGDPTYTAPETDAERAQMTSQLRDLGVPVSRPSTSRWRFPRPAGLSPVRESTPPESISSQTSNTMTRAVSPT